MAKIKSIFRRERLIIAACLAVMAALAWLYLLESERTMSSMRLSGMDMPGMDMSSMPGMTMTMTATQPWSAASVFLLFLMWAVMMVAMMLPSASPMVFAFLGLNERRQAVPGPAAGRTLVPVGIFVLGYLAIWTAYSALAALAQWQLHRLALLSPAMAATSPYLSGGLLIAAGLFQWTPLKRACLKGCRSPLTFLMTGWREGKGGAFLMGLRHGSYCVGCCWVLMALLFVAGVMNLLWVALIALFVTAEKLAPRGALIGTIAGMVMIVSGIALLLPAL